MKLAKGLLKSITVENVLGLLFSALIIFEFKQEEEIRRLMNTNIGMVVSLISMILMFMWFNPLVAILFLIYFYENVKLEEGYPKIYDRLSRPNILDSLKSSMNKVKNEKDVVEIETIRRMAPIVTKREKMGVNFEPNVADANNYITL